MKAPTFQQVTCAYQLHVYFCFKTHRLRPQLEGRAESDLIHSVLSDVCRRDSYHLLQADVSPDHLRVLLSLKPDQPASRVSQMLKGNISRQFGSQFSERLLADRSKTLWARGYFATTSGKVDIDAARRYIESQPAHHGYMGQWTDALTYHNPSFTSPVFNLKHSLSMLDYHVVICTQLRSPIFDDVIAPKLFAYTRAVGEKVGFAVERMSMLPDHVHLLIQLVPSVSVSACVLSLMNNTAHWMSRNYSSALQEAEAFQVWQPSFYAGTVGEYTTAQVKSFLAMG